jgi:hypothetical protein
MLAAAVTLGSSSDASVATGSIEKTTYVVTSGNMGPTESGSVAEHATDLEWDISDMLFLTRCLEGSDKLSANDRRVEKRCDEGIRVVR